MRLKDIGEIKLIERLARRIRLDKSVVKGIGDDTAVIKWTKDKYLLFASDMLVENVHFRLREASPFQIGWKALGRNISDIAAMGGVARYALVSAGLKPDLSLSFIDGIYSGIRALADKFRINIVGGDTSFSDRLVIDISILGEVERGSLAMRSGAKKGDVILLTGSIGGAIKGKHLNFIPRLREARLLVKNFKVNSMIDISDGLALDLSRILRASSVGATIYQDAVPLSKNADSFDKALRAGEDFELLFTMDAKEARRFFRTALSKMDVPVTVIGEITDRSHGYILRDWRGKEKILKVKGYLHF